MALFDISELKKYRYKIEQCILVFGSESIFLKSMNVTGMFLFDNYAERTFPIFKLNLVTDKTTYYKIMQNKSTLKIHLTIYKYYIREEFSGEIINKSPFEKWLDDDYMIIPDDADIKKDSDLTRGRDLYNAGDQNAGNEWNCISELYLYRQEVAIGLKKRLNTNLKNTTLSSAITWALSESGIRNCVMSPLENARRYDSIFIPPLTVNRLLQHLDAMYGFYRCGSIIYFGIKRSYILNYRGECTAWERDEKTETCFLSPKMTNIVSSGNGGVVDKNDNKNYIFWEYKDINFSNPSMVDNVLVGTDATVIDPTAAKITTSKSKALTNDGRATSAVINNTTENKWIDTTFTVQSSSKSKVLSGSVVNIDIDALTPNKLFTVVLEDPAVTNSYKGKYTLVRAMHNFINDSATGDFSIISAIEIRKMETTSVSSEIILK